MKDRYLIAIPFVIVVLQTTLLQILRVAGIMPNIMLIWVVVGAVLFRRGAALKLAIYAGVIMDFIAGKGLAVHFSIYVVIALVISALQERIFKDNFVTPIVLIVVATVFCHVFFALSQYFSTGNFTLIERFFSRTVFESIYNLVIGVPTYAWLFKRLMGYQVR